MEIGPADVARGRDQDYVDVAGLSVIALTQVIALLTSTAGHHLSPSVQLSVPTAYLISLGEWG
eukprot:CAMPEP_0173105552 /NCGR_PEP_ID=MMETSP1102-20130122/40196_1 /TAXON_ID=49646 /ORGANISM="Geminigera sp., Strain Caron Lab Isolate" /LENGTH=62 /DNA_ID=CAMNT_0014001865 /DNA_START=105 /DNA_END=289 /DNA_ORIENTATION=-